MSGTKGHSGRRRKAAVRRYGETWVRLSMAASVDINGHSIVHCYFANNPVHEWWLIDNEDRFTDYAAAATEFVRRVNVTRK